MIFLLKPNSTHKTAASGPEGVLPETMEKYFGRESA